MLYTSAITAAYELEVAKRRLTPRPDAEPSIRMVDRLSLTYVANVANVANEAS